MKFAVFSVCTPDFTYDEVVELLVELGYDGIEPRVHVPSPEPKGTNFWSDNKVTVDITALPGSLEKAVATARDAGLDLPDGGLDSLQWCRVSVKHTTHFHFSLFVSQGISLFVVRTAR